MWDSVPQSIRAAEHLVLLKSKLRKYLLGHSSLFFLFLSFFFFFLFFLFFITMRLVIIIDELMRDWVVIGFLFFSFFFFFLFCFFVVFVVLCL